MVDFTDRRLLGSAAPARFEVDLRDCEVAGEIPKDLDGALYRLHMDWLYPPTHADETILAADLEHLRAGGIHWRWDSSKPSWHAVIPRTGGAEDIRFFFGPERSIVHTANARTEGNRIVLEGPVANGNTWPWFTNLNGKPYTPVPNTLRRITLDLSSGTSEVLEEPLFDTNITTFTRIDERFMTLYRYIYVQYADTRFESGNLLGRTDGNCVGRFDLRTGTLKPYFPGPGRALQEPVFVPRSAQAAEGDGYVVAVGHNIAQATTELYLLDALRMEELARVTLPFRTAPQVHGTWGDPTTLPLQ